MKMRYDNLEVRLAATESEVAASQELRYKVFVEENGAKTGDENSKNFIESDEYDSFCEHLILIDKSKDDKNKKKIVGVSRLMADRTANENLGFYSAKEYDLTKILKSGKKCLEIGRSCIDKEYRNTLGLHLMWNGISKYSESREIELLFGMVSFKGCNIQKCNMALSLLHHQFLISQSLRIKAHSEGFCDMNMISAELINKSKAMEQMPSLLKGYLRLGGKVGEGAFIDRHFNTIDVALIIETDLMKKKYKEFYGRTGQ